MSFNIIMNAYSIFFVKNQTFKNSFSSPTKHDFIVAKYKHLALLPRMSLKDSANMSQDLSKVRIMRSLSVAGQLSALCRSNISFDM